MFKIVVIVVLVAGAALNLILGITGILTGSKEGYDIFSYLARVVFLVLAAYWVFVISRRKES